MAKVKRWRTDKALEECDNCGNETEMYTSCDKGWYQDGADVRCLECGQIGTLSVDEEENIVSVNWVCC